MHTYLISYQSMFKDSAGYGDTVIPMPVPLTAAYLPVVRQKIVNSLRDDGWPDANVVILGVHKFEE